MFVNYAIEKDQLKLVPLSTSNTFKGASKQLREDVEKYLAHKKLEVTFYDSKKFEVKTHYAVHLKNSSGCLYKVEDNSGWLSTNVNQNKVIKFGVTELEFPDYQKTARPTNYDHGNHITFLNELKDKLKNKNQEQNNLADFKIEKKVIADPILDGIIRKKEELKPTETVVKTIFDLFDREELA